MALASFAKVYKEMPPDERLALSQLKAEEEKRTGKTLSTREVLEAVTPGFPDPDYLKATPVAVAAG